MDAGKQRSRKSSSDPIEHFTQLWCCHILFKIILQSLEFFVLGLHSILQITCFPWIIIFVYQCYPACRHTSLGLSNFGFFAHHQQSPPILCHFWKCVFKTQELHNVNLVHTSPWCTINDDRVSMYPQKPENDSRVIYLDHDLTKLWRSDLSPLDSYHGFMVSCKLIVNVHMDYLIEVSRLIQEVMNP
ncbi:hypothetical protein VNO77_20137 [Canavalia gladiata]|uniref:Uncharacterized protein n=1 Tax=Canavalia gladiata TaxID=3824 RepID=A0AAN9LP33_CANGL